MTIEHLGLAPDGQVPVFVHWFEPADLTQGMAAALAQLAPGFTCPACGGAVDLQRSGGVVEKVGETPNCRSVSDRCSHCLARLHFDTTPAAVRGSLRWTAVAVGGALQMPDAVRSELARAIVARGLGGLA